MEAVSPNSVRPAEVKELLSEHMLTKGMMPMVLDMEASQGVRLHDQKSGRSLIDLFGFYASNPLGMNHPKMSGDEAFMERLVDAALNKVTNSDVMTGHMARFVDTFDRVGIPDYLPYTFFISGGALAVENALKTAFDWKVRKNHQKGYRREVGHQVLHLDQAFHGRTGYTMSLTNTADPRKTMYFPKFDWPRITNPKVHFPLDADEKERVRAHEEEALRQAKRHFHEREDQIAAVILEPIQGEGGDNHFRPAFLRELKALAHENDTLLVFDEVQSGVGITGEFWAHQALGVKPDIMAFGKKSQVCGILAGRKLDEVDDHVFETPSRINSTWGGNIVDMVRFDRILEIMEEEQLVDHAGRVGTHLQHRLHELAEEFPAVSNVRGEGLMTAFTLPSTEYRDHVAQQTYEEGAIILGCGDRSIRFRTPLTITEDEVDEGMACIRRALKTMASEHGPHANETRAHAQ
ncbi:L-lysine 6-transaminase [Salinibacter ruber]|uniref:L-lysine-epsilon aminotransferase n=1 Tax=Salinibacter ruber TaxID=146919 RepID=A0A9X2U9J4_9BACT|nr:L-lysine 6-transaminase [Salinibacter ruber]MCS3657273.1 L-lysine 6-transaminase [Salinibacter ruber]MCS3952244.1 L-lysine 6-transaminase [Salinibacter ruber]MCS4118693.1 L-lysine 6-transaminase [Salinibacter ruber]MCS4154876.1 L-lysine 6-transaminase [Salinibacter ruber]MCS4170948.1 L-lysine 6-transaminase [Salinibacter ruber]